MANVYEVDPHADALIILSSPSQNGYTDEPAKSSAKPVKVNGHVNGVTNGHANGESHELIRLKVSSKHLSLASRHFRNMNGRNGENFSPIEPDGRMHFRLEGFDQTAVTIVMNIIHSRGHRVPKSVDLETLTKVASFVDAFKFHEAVEAYADRWIVSLSKSVPSKYNEQVLQWIFIAHAFHHSQLFKDVTRLAIRQSTDAINEPNTELPIPDTVIRSIDDKRQELIGQVISFLQELVVELQRGETPCTNGCDTFLLGVLVKALHRWKLAKPYPSISFEAVATAVRDIQDEVWYTGPHSPITLGGGKEKTPADSPQPVKAKQNRSGIHHCGVRSLINPKLYSMGVSLEGLTLKSGF